MADILATLLRAFLRGFGFTLGHDAARGVEHKVEEVIDNAQA